MKTIGKPFATFLRNVFHDIFIPERVISLIFPRLLLENLTRSFHEASGLSV